MSSYLVYVFYDLDDSDNVITAHDLRQTIYGHDLCLDDLSFSLDFSDGVWMDYVLGLDFCFLAKLWFWWQAFGKYHLCLISYRP